MKPTATRLVLIVATAVVHPTVNAQQFDPQAAVQWSLKELQHAPPVTYRTNGNMVFCTAHCRDLDERNTVFDAFQRLPNAGVTGTKAPPEACVVLPLDPAAFQRKQQVSRYQAMVQKAMTEQRAKQRQAIDQANHSLASLMDSEPEKLYGQQITVVGEYEGIETKPGDLSYELGFSISEKGKHLSCVAFSGQITGDPITFNIPIGACQAVRSLHVNDRVRITGKVISPSLGFEAVPHLRRAAPFFVALAIERL